MVTLRGDRSDRWGQDRDAMTGGHWTGLVNSALDEDTVVQISMGPITDRTKEHLSSSDVAIVQARRLILDTLAAAEAGELPPGSARGPEPVRLAQPFEGNLEPGSSWRDLDMVVG